MTRPDSLQTLLSLVPPEHGADEQVDWGAAEEALGTRLPSDYRAFMAVYGAGSFGELDILGPLPVEYPQWDPGSIVADTPQLRMLCAEEAGPLAPAIDAAAVLAWGAGCNANELGWLTVDEDPDRWPVVAWRRQIAWNDSHVAVFDCGMTDFLVRMMRAEFDTCPLGDASLWGKTAPFVHWREQQRRWQAGLCPETGEPDPVIQGFLQWPDS